MIAFLIWEYICQVGTHICAPLFLSFQVTIFLFLFSPQITFLEFVQLYYSVYEEDTQSSSSHGPWDQSGSHAHEEELETPGSSGLSLHHEGAGALPRKPDTDESAERERSSDGDADVESCDTSLPPSASQTGRPGDEHVF